MMVLKGEVVLGEQAGLTPPQVQFLLQKHAEPEHLVVAMSYLPLVLLLERCGQLMQTEAVKAAEAVKSPQTALPLHYICDQPLQSGRFLLPQLFWDPLSCKWQGKLLIKYS